MSIPDFGFGTTLANTPHQEAIARVTSALKEEGFGVLTTIDAQGTFKKKLDVDHRPYTILGACNPGLAMKGIAAEPHLGLLLPCNVLVQETDAGQLVSFMDPVAMMAAAGGMQALTEIADDASARLRRVCAAL